MARACARAAGSDGQSLAAGNFSARYSRIASDSQTCTSPSTSTGTLPVPAILRHPRLEVRRIERDHHLVEGDARDLHGDPRPERPRRIVLVADDERERQGRPPLVSRTRSSHDCAAGFLRTSGSRDTRKSEVAGVASIRKFASEQAESAGELPNRDTRLCANFGSCRARWQANCGHAADHSRQMRRDRRCRAHLSCRARPQGPEVDADHARDHRRSDSRPRFCGRVRPSPVARGALRRADLLLRACCDRSAHRRTRARHRHERMRAACSRT